MTAASPRLTSSARVGLVVLLAGYGFIIARSPDEFRLIENVDLAIHETGHLVFGFFGEFVGFSGGTLLQLIVPITFFGYFRYHGDRFAASVVLWWVAQNLWNISVYVKDARSQLLPLVGGGEHDWAYLLGNMGLLERDQGVGQTVFLLGLLVFIASIVWSAMNIGAPVHDKGSA